MKPTKVVGKSLPRLDGPETVSGKALYTADHRFASVLCAKLFRSSITHGRIKRLDFSRARKLPGVAAVVGAADLPLKRRFGTSIRDEEIFAGEKVRFIGDVVAAVAAVDEATAERAVALIDCEYEELPAVLTTDEASAEGAPLVHESLDSYGLNPIMARKWNPRPNTNIAHEAFFSKGDVERGFGQADRIFEDVFRTEQVHHCALEPHATIAGMEDGRLIVWTTTQNVFQVRAELAHLFDLADERIRVIGTKVGGGFGGKNVSLRVEPHVVALALRAGRPVRLILDRTEEFNATAGSVPAVVRVRTGVTRDGRITAKSMDFVWDAGAYAEGLSTSNRALKDGIGPYRIPNFQVISRLVYTNKLPGCPYRGLGIAEAVWATESQMDIIADDLGLDPVDLRLRNCLDQGDETPAGDAAENIALKECLHRVSTAIGRPKKRAGARRGVGFSLLHKSPTTSNTLSIANVRIDEDGGIELRVGASDVGGGAGTSLAQIAAEVLGVALRDVGVVIADTDLTPFDHGTFSSRVTSYVGVAVKLAAEDVARRLLQSAARTWSVPESDLRLSDKKVIAAANRSMGFGEIARSNGGRVILGEGVVEGKGHSAGAKSKQGAPADSGWPFGAQAVEVEVDEETGVVRVLRVVSAHDVGKAINPLAVAGQIEGGVVMGIGYGMYEQLIFEDGRIVNPSFGDYKIPTCVDAPRTSSVIVEKPYDAEPFGAKGVGEVSLFGIAPAIANAVARATGVRIKELPITSEKVFDRLKAQATKSG